MNGQDCGDPGPWLSHCTEGPGHPYSCYDAGQDRSFNRRMMLELSLPHQCDETGCPLAGRGLVLVDGSAYI